MKKNILMILTIIAFLLLNNLAFSNSLVWNPPTGETPKGYIIYYAATDNSTIEFSKNVGNVTEYPLIDLNIDPGVEYMFTVTAYNDAGQSDRSNAVSYVRAKFIPVDNPKMTIITKPQAPISLSIKL